jgi:endonuclease YncB( thermonuclease family)
MYQYKAKINRVVDGDTVNLTIDLGFRLTYTANCRLAGINAPEMNTAEGKASKEWLSGYLVTDLPFDITSTGLDKYGRPIVELFFNKMSINQKMVEEGYAAKY